MTRQSDRPAPAAATGSSIRPPHTRSWSALDRRLFAALVVSGLLSVPVLVHPYYDVVGDGSIYLATARSLLAGDGYTYLDAPYRVRPPGLSLLLTPVLAAFGHDQLALNALILMFGLLGVVLLFVHQRPRLGGPLALLVSLAIWLNPGYQKYATQILSDVPGLAAAFLCLLVARWSHREPSLRREVILGLCIGLATYLRSALILLLPALWLARLLRPSLRLRDGAAVAKFALRSLIPVGLVVAAVVLPWSIRNAAVAPTGPVDQTVIYDYSTAQWHTSWTDPESPWISLPDLLARVDQRSHQIVRSLGTRMLWGTASAAPSPRALDPGETALTAILLLGLVWQMIVRRDMASIFAFSTLCVLLVYFDYHARLGLPVYVIALAACVERARDSFGRVLGAARGALLVALLLVCLIVVDFDPRRGRALAQANDLDLRERCSQLERIQTPHTRFATSVGWHYTMCLSRPVFGIAQRIFREKNASAVEQVIDRHRVDVVFLDTTSRYDARFAPYFELKYGPARRAGVLQYWRVREATPDRPPLE